MKYLNPAMQQQAFKEYLQQPGTAALANFGNNLLNPQQQGTMGPNGQQQQPANMFEGMQRKDIEKTLPLLLQQENQRRVEEGKNNRQREKLAHEDKMRAAGASEAAIEKDLKRIDREDARKDKEQFILMKILQNYTEYLLLV